MSFQFGPRDSEDHKGIDIAANYGDPIYASVDGTVSWATTSKDSEYPGGGGYTVVINSNYNNENVRIRHMHMKVPYQIPHLLLYLNQ